MLGGGIELLDVGRWRARRLLILPSRVGVRDAVGGIEGELLVREVVADWPKHVGSMDASRASPNCSLRGYM